jgi:hypothetical protein
MAGSALHSDRRGSRGIAFFVFGSEFRAIAKGVLSVLLAGGYFFPFALTLI